MARNIVSRCLVCGTELKTFVAYIPGVGESCLDCFKKAATADELVLVATRKTK